MEEGTSTFEISTGTPTGKIPRLRWEDNIRIKEIRMNTRDWVDVAQDRDYWRTLVNSVLNLRVP